MIKFLKDWFMSKGNIGRSFKYAYEALINEFGLEQVSVSKHGCYKAFKKYSNFTYKRIQRVNIKSNTDSNKLKRMQYLLKFLPYHKAKEEGRFEIIFIDEAGFNLNKQGMSYAWAERGKLASKEMPIKI